MSPKTPFTVYLDWIACSQFAGIFWAKEHGFYDAVGLDATVVPWFDDGRSVIEKVIATASDGALCAGCVEDNLVVSRFSADESVRVFGAMLQESPMVLMSRPGHGIRKIADLRGKRVGMHADGIRVLEMVLTLEGMSASELAIHEVGFDLEHLRRDLVDALQGYLMTEPVQLAAMGVDVDVTPITHLQLKPYAQVYFSEATLLAQHRERFADFLAASSAGWLAVCARPDDAAALVTRLMTENVGVTDTQGTEREQRRSLDRVIPLVLGKLPVARIGSIETGQWKRNLETYFEFGVIDRRLSVTDVAFEL